MRETIIIDTDPGQDDAVALLLAFASSDRLDLRAITTVAGNVPVAQTTANALRIRELAGAETPVHRGAESPCSSRSKPPNSSAGRTGWRAPICRRPRASPRPAMPSRQSSHSAAPRPMTPSRSARSGR